MWGAGQFDPLNRITTLHSVIDKLFCCIKKRKSLLVYFGGLEGVKNATIEELILVEGISKGIAEKIFNFFH